MPIVSISKIQQRYGLSDNLPQLSAAELGWAIDTRKLYIGNGAISEGAPTVGNTEILTEYSDILSVSDSYTYKGEAAGYTHQTGADPSTPATRTLQRKIDDFASVKDFGATGDGVTDDTAAISRAFNQLFCQETNPEVRRSLFFPAGIYRVTDTIRIPTYAKIYGEGKNSSIIRQASVSPGFAFADSLCQIAGNIGNNSATIPSYIEINDISFESTATGDVLQIASSQNCILRRVSLKGSLDTKPAEVGIDSPSCVKLSSTAVNQTQNLVFEQCDFIGNNFGVVADDDMQSILFNGCYFTTLYKGAKLGELTSGTGASVNGPMALRITNSMFDNIHNTGIHVYSISGITSAYNYFGSVAIDGGNPTADIIIFANDGNASVGDTFTRTDADTAVYRRVNSNGYEAYVLDANDGIYYGYHKTEAGKSVVLNDNSSAVSSGISFSSTDEKTNLLYYTATRGSNVRHGQMRITASSSGSTLTDEYNEDGTDIGLTFAVAVVGSVATLNYTTTSTGNDVIFKYRIERLV